MRQAIPGPGTEPIEDEVEELVESLGAASATGGLDEHFAAAYRQLRGVAHAQRRRWPHPATLSTTAVVHEAYLRLAHQQNLVWKDRGHFFRVAARAMRFILINYAQSRWAAKRGAGAPHLSVDQVPAEGSPLIEESRLEEVLALDEALTRLNRFQPRWARVVECRAFAGLDLEETAEALEVSTRTVQRDWRYAQAWLYDELHG